MKLSGNILKIIAAITMLCDHVGLLYFPDIDIFRIIGRIAFPIFAYFIAEGCRYTKNKLRYFLTVLATAFVCQVVDYVTTGSLYMCVLVTFSVSILVIYALQFFKKHLLKKDKRSILCALIFAFSIWSAWKINTIVEIDYGFWGCMLPVFVSLFQPVAKDDDSILKKLDSVYLHTAMLTIGLIILAVNVGWLQPYSIMSVPILLLYSGERGKLNLKYFFYIFYPAHLALLVLIGLIIW